MQFLCLAYGAEGDWNNLSKQEQDTLLAADKALREQGFLMGAVRTNVTTVRAWDGTPIAEDRPVAPLPFPLAGFSVIEAEDLQQAIAMVSNTPCARAKGAIEIRPILALHDPK